ncbi:MAG TPA: hypothetical protein DDY29_08325 [Rhodobacteraceae bacterium]|nr:hypothetical protein [Paracoccaceae bacterium]
MRRDAVGQRLPGPGRGAAQVPRHGACEEQIARRQVVGRGQRRPVQVQRQRVRGNPRQRMPGDRRSPLYRHALRQPAGAIGREQRIGARHRRRCLRQKSRQRVLSREPGRRILQCGKSPLVLHHPLPGWLSRGILTEIVVVPDHSRTNALLHMMTFKHA